MSNRLKEDMNNLYFSTGEQLDKFGQMYNVYRIVETDIQYRLRIIDKIESDKHPVQSIPDFLISVRHVAFLHEEWVVTDIEKAKSWIHDNVPIGYRVDLKIGDVDDKDKRIKELELMLFDSDLHLEAAIEEINRLKAILKDVKLTAEWHIEGCACSHPMSKYQLGWFEAMNLIKEKVGE